MTGLCRLLPVGLDSPLAAMSTLRPVAAHPYSALLRIGRLALCSEGASRIDSSNRCDPFDQSRMFKTDRKVLAKFEVGTPHPQVYMPQVSGASGMRPRETLLLAPVIKGAYG